MKKLFAFLIISGILVLSFPGKSLSQTATGDSVYSFVTKMPEYPGGQKGMLTYFVLNMRYPLAAYTNGISGTAYVNFIVETDGSVSDVLVLKPIGYGCDEEATRLVSQMTGWEPGEQDGKKVRVRSNIPVYFKEDLYPNSRIYMDLDTMPVFPGGSIELLSYIESELVYPEHARSANINGIINVDFVVEKDGNVSNVTVNNSLGYGCDVAAAKVILRSPKWEPGYYSGKPARVLLSVPVTFKSFYKIVEQMPDFPGGRKELIKYISQNLIYPEEAMEKQLEGQVIVNFLVESNGVLSNVKVVSSMGSGCDEEALRLVNNMPDWSPGKKHGKPVPVQYNLAVEFRLSE